MQDKITSEIKDKMNKIVDKHQINLWKVGIALPMYWNQDSCPKYCFITEDGYHLNENFDWNNNI